MGFTIFLGAGASKAEGAPMQNELFKEYFKEKRDKGKALTGFFKNIFNINLYENADEILFPTFEEVLGILDLSEQRDENITKAYDKKKIISIREEFVMLMAEIIAIKLKNKNEHHYKLVENLKKEGLLKNTAFISTNYDILIDNALLSHYQYLNYGVQFTNYDIEENSVKLFKVHGSLNWLYCPTCNTLQLTPREKGILKGSNCDKCGSSIVPIIVPPTYFKNMSNIYLSNIWNRVEQELRQSQVLVFCGYSFPDADIHIKYLLKRAQISALSNLKKVIVLNHYEGKKDYRTNDEKQRYERFFGRSLVSFTENSFEDFANNPSAFLLPKNKEAEYAVVGSGTV